MAVPNWTPHIDVVLGHPMELEKRHSERTGNDYTAEVIRKLPVRSTGNIEDVGEGNYRYSIVDQKTGLEYAIKVAKKIEVSFGTPLMFKNVRGGATARGGWYAADDVEVMQKNNNSQV